jgi:hypothetical protein
VQLLLELIAKLLVKNKGKDRCKVVLVYVMKAHRGSGGAAPLIPNVDSRWK